MAEKIRVLQSVNSLGMGGTVIFVMNFFRHIDKEKFQVDFLIYDDSQMDFYEEVKAAGSQVHVCVAKSKNKLLKLFSEMRQVRKVLRENSYDIIHCHGNSFKEFLRGAIPGKFAKNTRVVTHAHNPGEPTNTWIDNLWRSILKTSVSRIVDRGCSCSDVAGEGKYTEKFINGSNYKLINNAIDTDRYIYDEKKRNELRKELGINEGDFVLGHVGRISYQKNHMFLIDIFKEYVDKFSDAKLLLVGEGELRNAIEEKIKEYQIEESVIFTGKCENAAKYYSVMDCFLLPSLYEGFPFVLVEAQINGLRSVIADTISRSVNISGGVEFLSLKDDISVWVDKINQFGNSRMAQSEIDIVIEGYELKNEVKNLEKMYLQLK